MGAPFVLDTGGLIDHEAVDLGGRDFGTVPVSGIEALVQVVGLRRA